MHLAAFWSDILLGFHRNPASTVMVYVDATSGNASCGRNSNPVTRKAPFHPSFQEPSAAALRTNA